MIAYIMYFWQKFENKYFYKIMPNQVHTRKLQKNLLSNVVILEKIICTLDCDVNHTYILDIFLDMPKYEKKEAFFKRNTYNQTLMSIIIFLYQNMVLRLNTVWKFKINM